MNDYSPTQTFFSLSPLKTCEKLEKVFVFLATGDDYETSKRAGIIAKGWETHVITSFSISLLVSIL